MNYDRSTNEYKIKYIETSIEEDQNLIDLINERIERAKAALFVAKELQGAHNDNT